MLKLFFKITTLSLASSLFIIGFFLLSRDNDNPQHSFLKGRFLKQERLSNIETPRVILCGGSNLAFGIDTKLIQTKTGLEIVNMGLSRSLGLPYMLKELKGKVKANDIVIFALEFDYYYKKQLLGFTPLFMIENNLNNLEYFNNKDDLTRIINFTPRYLQIKINQFLSKSNNNANPIYHENAFNEYGDVISHLEFDKTPKNINYNVFNLDHNTTNIALINNFVEEHPEAKIFTVFPSFLESNFKIHQKEVEALYQLIKIESKTKFIGKSDSFVFPDNYFFDSVYHLNKKGRKLRSERLAILINSKCK
tara:strand:+ start:19713 stop:20633 length:921 start_codon:yes stop_codon:yes gene_type:complete